MFQLTCPGKQCVKHDVLSGLTVALALVPEAVAFAFVAGVAPLAGLYTVFMMGIITAIIGGRPGMISGVNGLAIVIFIAQLNQFQVTDANGDTVWISDSPLWSMLNRCTLIQKSTDMALNTIKPAI